MQKLKVNGQCEQLKRLSLNGERKIMENVGKKKEFRKFIISSMAGKKKWRAHTQTPHEEIKNTAARQIFSPIGIFGRLVVGHRIFNGVCGIANNQHIPYFRHKFVHATCQA